MSKKQKNANLPLSAAVKSFDDGGVLRNDGLKLTCASKNQWYLLATVAGEQGAAVSESLTAKNRRFWNGWMCQNMSSNERRLLADKLNLPASEIEPPNETEKAAIYFHFEKAFPEKEPNKMVPSPLLSADMRCVYFSKHVDFSGFYFPTLAHFENAYFNKTASFKLAYLNDANFTKAHFECGASFGRVRFKNVAIFNNVYFNSTTIFNGARFASSTSFVDTVFYGSAHYEATEFSGVTVFSGAYFGGFVNFSDGVSMSTVAFDAAHFKGRVPMFFHHEMRQDATFSEDDRLWPKVSAQNAAAGRQAYTRLRQIASQQHNSDLEHFFMRQEMRCKEGLGSGLIASK